MGKKKKKRHFRPACKIILDEYLSSEGSVFTKTDPHPLYSLCFCKKLCFALYVFFTPCERMYVYVSAEFIVYRRLDIYIRRQIYTFISLKGECYLSTERSCNEWTMLTQKEIFLKETLITSALDLCQHTIFTYLMYPLESDISTTLIIFSRVIIIFVSPLLVPL